LPKKKSKYWWNPLAFAWRAIESIVDAAAAAAQNLVHFTMTVSESTAVAMEGTVARVIFFL
jgi:predicted protein tyrosine phosphatase